MSNETKLTAVDKIVVLLNKKGFTPVLTEEEIKFFKEMEKEKTIKFTEDWYFNGPLLGEGIDVKSTIEQHFNNTYGGGEQ